MNKKIINTPIKSLGHNKAFTLLELLVVIALSVILIALLLIPVYKTLENNRMTAAVVNAQKSSRDAMAKIRKDISQSMYVFDSSGTPMLLPVNGLVDADGNPVDKPVVLQNGVLNLVMPKTEFYCSNPDHDPNVSRAFSRGDKYSPEGLELAINKCPSCNTDKFVSVVPKTPVEKGNTIVRYFLGLKTNNDDGTFIMEPNGNILDDPLAWKTVIDEGWKPDQEWNEVDGIDNSLVLYRVEFDPFKDSGDENLFPAEYKLPANRSLDPEKWDRIYNKRISDPNLFYHPEVADAWKAKVETVGLAKAMDLGIALKSDYKDGHPFRVIGSVAFMPAAITGEAPEADDGNTALLDAQGLAFSSFRTKYGLLSNTLKVEIVRPDEKQVPQKRWVLERSADGNYSMLKRSASATDIKSALFNIFDLNDYFYNGDTVPFDDLEGNPTEMALTYNQDAGKIIFSMNPRPMPSDLTLPVDQNRLHYYPDVDVYGYKFLEYDNATVVPGSETVYYYNAYFKDDINKKDILENHWYTYDDLETNNVTDVRYQRAPFSVGQLNYNQYKIDYETGIIYWKPVVNHTSTIYPKLYMHIPTVDYAIQFNRLNDKITVSYSTNEVIDVVMDMRMAFDRVFNPKSSLISEKVVVGNALR